MKTTHFRAAAIATVTTLTILGASFSPAAADNPQIDPPQGSGITLNDGSTLTPGNSVEFTFKGDRLSDDLPTTSRPMSVCPEVNDPPTYEVSGKPWFIPDTDKPQSTWLLPRQTVSWAVSGSHTFTWDVSGGVEVEAGAILTKAKVKFDTKISNSWTWNSTQTVTDTNSTAAAYRAVLGQVGWRLTAVKSWVVAPCTGKSKTIVVLAPRKGDMSIGRQNS